MDERIAEKAPKRSGTRTRQRRTSKPSKPLPTTRIAFAKQLDILRAYAAASQPDGKSVSNSAVAELLKMKAGTITFANAFFSDVGFIEKTDGGYLPSPEVVSFFRAHEWEPDTAKHKLAPVIERSWFFKRLQPKLRFAGLNEEQALQDLADEASAGRDYRAELRLLLQYMEASALIARDNGRIELAPQKPSREQLDGGRQQQPGSTLEQPRHTPATPDLTSAVSSPPEGVVQFDVSVRVAMSEFKGWDSERISNFFAGIAQVLAAKGGLKQETGQT